MKNIISIICFWGLAISLSAQVVPNMYKKADPKKMNHWVDSIFSKMTVDEKIGQLFMIVADPSSKQSNTQVIQKHITSRYIGGVLFAKGSVADQVSSTNLYQKTSKIPLLISLDGEWGLSMRLSDTPRFPRNMVLGAMSEGKTLELYGAEVARQCREMGIQINFAPVLDVNSNPKNPVIGTRSFGENPERVALSGIAYAKGLESRGVMAVAKHFPGHGDTAEDSHRTTPTVSHDWDQLQQEDIYPFRQYVSAGFSGMMSGHLNVPALDSLSGKPASLSPVVSAFLKDSLGFSGLSFTDALVMKGASSKDNVCVQALLAGNDILLSPGKPVEDVAAVKKAVNDQVIPLSVVEEKCRKILQYKYILGLNQFRPVSSKGMESRLNTDSTEWVSRKLNAESVTLLKNKDAIIPVKQLDVKRIASISLGENGISNFQRMLKNYAKVDAYTLSGATTLSSIEAVFKKLSAYDLIVCGIHSAKTGESNALRKLAAEKNVILCFFISPYDMPSFKTTTISSQAVLQAYENTDYAQEAAAQVIMGGLKATGKLPVTVTGLFEEGTGFLTEKVRLSYQSPLEVGMSPEKLKAIDRIVEEGLKEKAFPGCQVLVAKNGAVIYEKSFGFFDYAGTHPVENTDMYDLASVTKVMATLPAVMKLYDQKKLALSDKLSKYVKEIQQTDKDDITIKDALFHESGLTSFVPFYQLTIDKNSYDGNLFSRKRDLTFRIQYDDNVYGRIDFKYLPDLVSKTSKKGFNIQVADDFYLNDSFRLMMLKDIGSSKLQKKGSYRYSDLNFMLLKETVEDISDTSLDLFLADHFYKRLGADYTMFQPLSHRADPKAIAPTENDQMIRNQLLVGYVHDEAAAFMGGVSGNAGLFSNANDLAKLLQLFLNGGTYGGESYFSKATVDLFTQTKSSSSRRGLGFDKPDPDKKPDYLPASVYGHTGFTGTSVWVDPDNQLIYIFLSNRVYPTRTNKKLSTLNIREKIQEAIYRAIKK